MRYFAHTLEGSPKKDWQNLQTHLEAVSEMAAEFASEFEGSEWARVAGLWHDLGKYSDAFQDYLRAAASPDPHVGEVSARIDHSSAGAQHAVSELHVLGHLPAFVIAGHHSGLLDARSAGACLEARLRKEVPSWTRAPAHLLHRASPELPPFVREAVARRDAFTIAFFTRMVFSCIVDADFLDTECFMNPRRSDQRPSWPEEIVDRMEQTLDAYVEDFDIEASPVNRHRSHVREACLEAATEERGLFSLTVPTGGGKTLSSLAFALRHSRLHNLRRVIYVVPFTSIIEQNAAEFRKALEALKGDFPDPVIEHHSNLDVGSETTASRLASENWDAPVIVTTSVQFYESLFANRSSRCRKLHNLSNSVIILDEVQTLPVDYLEPCLNALSELTSHYGATVVLCTATQPAVERRDGFDVGLEGVREIVPDPRELYTGLKRVQVKDLGTLIDDELVERLLGYDRVLCIVNTRRHARELFDRIGDRHGHFHLSALMCGEHRSTVVAEIHEALSCGGLCRVISTQLIEAGVDIDFPVVFRALSGLDSIAQAAGRCNRNGTLESGYTFVFRSEHETSERFLAETSNCAGQILPLYDDPLSLDAIEHFFRLYYWDQSSRWDAKGICEQFHLNQDRELPFLFGFATVAERFRIIEETGRPVIVPWREEGTALCEGLRRSWDVVPRGLLRRLQRYTVNVPIRIWNEQVGRTIELVHEQYPILMSPSMNYSERTGLDLDRGLAEPLVM